MYSRFVIVALCLLFFPGLSLTNFNPCFIALSLFFFYRDCIGDCSLAGDNRYAGSFGVNLDFVARCHCSVEFISVEDMQVCNKQFAAQVEN